MSNYTHLTSNERNQIADLKALGPGVRAIAAALGQSGSTISRELRRNALIAGLSRELVCPCESAAKLLTSKDEFRRFGPMVAWVYLWSSPDQSQWPSAQVLRYEDGEQPIQAQKETTYRRRA